MGGNGTASINGSIPVEDRKYVSLGTYSDPVYGDIEIVEWTATNQYKMPEESNSAPRMYMSFKKDGSDVHEIAYYGNDHKKQWSIHTDDHAPKKAIKKGTAIRGPHFHEWKDGQAGKPQKLTSDDPRLALVNRVRNFQKTKK